MDYEHDEADLMGQVAGIIAVMSAVVQALPPSTRKRLVPLVHAQFEGLIAAMSATGAETGSEGAEWVRDLFLKRIDQATKKPKIRKTAVPAGDALDIEF